MHASKARRRYARPLSAVESSALGDAVETYISRLSDDDVRAFVRRSADALPAAERAQLALYVRPQHLDSDDGLIGRRFTTFLRSHPQALEYLDPEALGEVAPEPPKTLPPEPRRFSWNAVGLGLLAFLVAVTPLAAQYAHQRGVLSGLVEDVAPSQSAPRLQQAAFVSERRAEPVTVAVHHPVNAHPRRIAPATRASAAPRRRAETHPRAVAHARSVRVVRWASNWKFDRRNYRYFSPESKTLSQRARLEVQSYLDAVISGNTRIALQHLGLPPDANLVNLSEVPIISRDSRARVVWVKPAPDGRTQVDADIHGRGGEYFEIFTVAADGPAVRIMDRYYIPVGKQKSMLR